jgi:WD40 repeat protein
LWNLEATDPAATKRILRGHTQGVTALAFTPDSRRVVTGSQDGTARLWDVSADRIVALATTIAGRSLSNLERAQYGLDGFDSQNTSLRGDAAKIKIQDVLAAWPTDARWHERMAAECRAAGHEFGARFHEARFKTLNARSGKPTEE